MLLFGIMGKRPTTKNPNVRRTKPHTKTTTLEYC